MTSDSRLSLFMEQDKVFASILIELIADFIDLHGRRPTADELIAMLREP